MLTRQKVLPKFMGGPLQNYLIVQPDFSRVFSYYFAKFLNRKDSILFPQIKYFTRQTHQLWTAHTMTSAWEKQVCWLYASLNLLIFHLFFKIPKLKLFLLQLNTSMHINREEGKGLYPFFQFYFSFKKFFWHYIVL